MKLKKPLANKKQRNTILIWVGVGLFFFVLIMVFFSNDNSQNNTSNIETNKEIDKSLFNQLSIQYLYDNGFCYEGMLEEEGKECGEAEYPFIRVYNAEDFEEAGKMLLITKVTDDLYDKIPELYNKEIVYVFRDKGQKSVDRIYVEKNEWSR